MMHKHHPASNLQTTPSSPQAFRLIPLGKPAPSRNHLPRQQQQPPASAMHRRGQDQEQGQGRNRGRSKKAYGYSGRNSRSNIGFVGPQQITDPTYEQHHDTNNDRLFSDGHGLDLAHIYESNISPHLQSQIAPKAAVWGSHVSIRSSDHPSNPSHLYSVRPTGSPNLLARVPRQDHHMYPSPHLLHGGGMAAYRVNGEATLGVGSTQYEVSDHITFHGHVPRYQPLAAKRFIKTHLPPGSVAMYTTPAFAPAPSHTFPNALSAYPIDLNPPVSSSLVPMGQYPSPWVYSTFAPPPPQLPPSVLLSPPSLMMTSRTLPPGPLGDHHPAATDEQDDIEVVLGIPDRISETESTVSSSSGVKEVEMASIQDHRKDRLREQLEWYFSPRNLMVDKYLLSHMDEKQFLPISVIANFKMVKALTSEIDEIVEALRMSPLVVVDESGTMVKPNVIKRPRTTLILRDLPLDTVEEEIRQVFEMEGQCSPETITKEVGNNWFVDFATEEKALAMLAFTRGRCIRGVPIAGRLKSTTTLAGLDFRSIPSSKSSETRQLSQDTRQEYVSGDYNGDPLTEAPLSYRRFPADATSHVPLAGYFSPPADQSWVSSSPYSHGQGFPPSIALNASLYPLTHRPSSLAGNNSMVTSAPLRRSSAASFGNIPKGRRMEGLRKQGRKKGLQHHHHQHQQHYRQEAEGEHSTPVVERRQNSFSITATQRSGQRHDSTERLLSVEEHSEPTKEVAGAGRRKSGRSNGSDRRQEHGHGVVPSTANSFVQGDTWVSTATALTTTVNLHNVTHPIYTPPDQKASQNQVHQDTREQLLSVSGTHGQSTPKLREEPQDPTTVENIMATDDVSRSVPSLALTEVGCTEKDKHPDDSTSSLTNSMTQMSIACVQQDKKSNLGVPEPSIDVSQSGQGALLTSLPHAVAKDDRQPLTKAGSGRAVKCHHSRIKGAKQSPEQQAKGQSNGDSYQEQPQQQQQRQQQRLPSRRQGRGYAGKGPSVSLIVPSVFDEALFPPMTMAEPSTSAAAQKAASATSRLSTGFSYASALKQPSHPRVTENTEESSETKQE